LARCQGLAQPRFFFYVPTLTADIPQFLIISGTVYASDLSPLSNALVEIWQNDDNQVNQPSPPILFSASMRTDEAGHYEFTTMRFTPSEPSYLHFRISHRDYCPLLLNLHPVVESQPRPARQVFAQVQVDGPVLRGSVDVVMPALASRR
jgi:hypothetical protein